MDKIYYHASSDTCRKIIKSLPKNHDFKFHDIKQDPITVAELEQMRALSGSYEALFSKKAVLYKSMDLKNKSLTEDDYKTVKEKAEKLGMKATQYAREMTLKGGIKSRFTLEELDLIRKLAGMANNLNQIARQANKTGFSNSAMEVMIISEEIKKLLDDR